MFGSFEDLDLPLFFAEVLGILVALHFVFLLVRDLGLAGFFEEALELFVFPVVFILDLSRVDVVQLHILGARLVKHLLHELVLHLHRLLLLFFFLFLLDRFFRFLLI